MISMGLFRRHAKGTAQGGRFRAAERAEAGVTLAPVNERMVRMTVIDPAQSEPDRAAMAREQARREGR